MSSGPHPQQSAATQGAETVEQVMALAEAWFRAQAAKARMAHGAAWTAHQAWVVDYLREEVRQRLLARGWRPRDGR